MSYLLWAVSIIIDTYTELRILCAFVWECTLDINFYKAAGYKQISKSPYVYIDINNYFYKAAGYKQISKSTTFKTIVFSPLIHDLS